MQKARTVIYTGRRGLAIDVGGVPMTGILGMSTEYKDGKHVATIQIHLDGVNATLVVGELPATSAAPEPRAEDRQRYPFESPGVALLGSQAGTLARGAIAAGQKGDGDE